MVPLEALDEVFPISRDPPEGGTIKSAAQVVPTEALFPISRDPPPKGEHNKGLAKRRSQIGVSNF